MFGSGLQLRPVQASPAVQTYRWCVPGKPVEVRLPLPLVDEIAAGVGAGLQTSGRGVETGGLLLGRTRREGNRLIVQIEEIEPVNCEHVVGPSFMLSATDRQMLEAQLRIRK